MYINVYSSLWQLVSQHKFPYSVAAFALDLIWDGGQVFEIVKMTAAIAFLRLIFGLEESHIFEKHYLKKQCLPALDIRVSLKHRSITETKSKTFSLHLSTIFSSS